MYFFVKMHKIPNFYQFFAFFAIFQLFSIDNNLSCVLYSRIPYFYIFSAIFLCQNAYNTNFFTNFRKFLLILTNYGLILGRPYFFTDFFQLRITYNVLFILEHPNFIFFYIFFASKCTLYQF